MDIAGSGERVSTRVAHKRLNRGAVVAERIVELYSLTIEVAEVAAQLRCGWGAKEAVRCRVVTKSFVRKVEESLVVAVVMRQDHGTADSPAKLVLL